LKYRLIYTQRAAKDIEKLSLGTRKRIGQSLLRYQEEPLKHAVKLTDARLGTYRFRIGDYRVIFDLRDNDIIVLRVGHRNEIYKR
jgi:mRNA interferase RelE/StbE